MAVWFRDSVLGRLALLGALILALQVPIFWIYGLVGEREGNRLTAIAEVQESWGGSQLAQGPVLVVPYRNAETFWFDPSESSVGIHYAYLRPRELRIRTTMLPIVRTRGIFDVLLYRAAIRFEGTFARPDPEELGIEEESILWDAIQVALLARPSVPDSIAIQDVSVLPTASSLESYVAAPLPNGTATSWPLQVAYVLDIDGSARFAFEATAGITHVELHSSWAHPKFVGNPLPVTRDVRRDGFTSTWEVTGPLGPRFEPWPPHEDPEAPNFGVELIQPVDAYRMTRRSIKYEFLFTALTLGVFFLIEVFGRYRVHPIQYLMVGSALVLFYLLVLSLSEHITFTAAYILAATGVVLLVSFYARAMFAKSVHAATVSATLSLVYGFLFVLLALQDYSLVMGSLGLFLVLASVMFLTRKIDWYAWRSGNLKTS